MSIGGNNQNNQPKSYTVKNKHTLFSEGNLNFTCLKFEYWNGLLVIKIEPCIKVNEGGNQNLKVDSDNNIAIYLTPLKCRLFYNAIKTFLNDPEKYTNVGVNSSNGLITFSNGDDYNISGNYLLSIKKVNEKGNIMSSLTYEFNKNDSIIVNFDDNSPSNNRDELDLNIEIDILLDVLYDFFSYSNSICAYWNNYTYEYFNNKRYEILSSIADKLGIDKGYKKNNSSFFENNNQSYSNNSRDVESNTLEDMI